MKNRLSQSDSYKFGEYDEDIYKEMHERALYEQKLVQEKLDLLKQDPVSPNVTYELVHEVINLTQPETANQCFLIAKETKNFIGPLQWVFALGICVRSGLIFIAYSFKSLLQRYLWIVIMVSYTVGKAYTNEIRETFILKNHQDLQAKFVESNVISIHNSSLVPEGQPIILTYSHKMLDYYGIFTYGISIALVIQNISQQQVNIYDWITMDEVMGNEKEARILGMHVILRCQKKMSALQCYAVHIDSLHAKIIKNMKNAIQSESKVEAELFNAASGV
jgi:hypothetical protein